MPVSHGPQISRLFRPLVTPQHDKGGPRHAAVVRHGEREGGSRLWSLTRAPRFPAGAAVLAAAFYEFQLLDNYPPPTTATLPASGLIASGIHHALQMPDRSGLTRRQSASLETL